MLPLISLAVPFVLGGLDYLRRQLLPFAPLTTGVSAVYTPLFTGGQCLVQYNIVIRDVLNGTARFTYSLQFLDGAIKGIEKRASTTNQGFVHWGIVHGVNQFSVYSTIPQSASDQHTDFIESITRADGQLDNCGDPPNPTPTPSISDDGLATSPSPNPNNFLPLITGIAAATAAAFLAAKSAAAAALAAAKSAAIGGNVADAIAKLADALAEILKLLAALEKKKAKEKDEEKTVSKYDFGRVEKDGFLRLYPNENLAKQELSYLDIQVENIPTYTGKYFGQLSPHYYRYKSLGYISFVSPTFGILETRQIDFRRLSLNPPENAFGFFYHFGLDGILKANLTGFYTKKEEEAEPPAT